ncbi:GAF domain-containing sensor histidine kinase [Ferdinandcohnia quinoae]|uniref:histidine kinase n=1 Tax=Fredinandcohnia quinoae TaxID=2918902 RepID=A0AAW5E1P2_9BACI|nr:GAF domain-containing sensor histidine kinase [Fredinandcohnia sp. SECRCQ15]MCH1625190.1 GAF domain-containing sensor histidine kinase [Fredinandcohnia sp. SECRCQ15]
MNIPVVSSQRREDYAKYYMTIISVIGWGIIIGAFFYVDKPSNFTELLLLTVFLFICEFYPIPVLRGFTTITFPLIFVLYIMFGLSYPIIIYAGVVVLVNIIHHRPLRTLIFNPAQLAISFFLAEFFVYRTNLGGITVFQSTIIEGISDFTLLLILFYIFNNVIVDVVLLLRPQPFTFAIWKEKTLVELNSAIFSFIYGIMIFILENQNSNRLDAFYLFFFFSPLVALSFLNAVISNLKMEKKRLNALFSISTDVNKRIHTNDWIETLKKGFGEVVNVQAIFLWVKENGEWKILYSEGRVNPFDKLSGEALNRFDGKKAPIVYHDRIKRLGPIDEFFKKDMKSFVYSPLVVENETIGMLVVGRSRVRSFEDDDIHSIATLSNQLAIAVKTRILIEEQEKRLILEERNRIAREIHDGVAQTLAGAIMKLETANRKFNKSPTETKRLVTDSISKLRQSLKEVRESIYELRPYPTERVGLPAAIKKRIEIIIGEYSLEISFDIRGKEVPLSSMVEKELFDIFQECLQNSIKHAKASRVEILLSYQKEHIILKIKDDGVGFSLFQAMIKAQNNPHFGILNMNDAADKINASLQIDSKEGEGTDISLTVPKMGLEGGSTDDQAYVGR